MKYNFLVAALGASAGGLNALRSFFSRINPESPVAYVVIQHSHREHKSQLPFLLSKDTPVKACEIRKGMSIDQRKIYVCPPSMEVSIKRGTFLLKTRLESEVINRTIDHFFKSLAEDARENAVGIIMSGTGGDGTAGFHHIEQHGGTTIVQDPSTAEFDGMPLHSIKYDHPDFILPPHEMPGVIHQLSERKFDFSVDH